MNCLLRVVMIPHRIYFHNFSSQATTIPGPKGLPILGTLLELIAAGSGPKLHLFIDQRHKQFGPIFKETLGPVNAVFISDPTDMRKVFSAEGKYPVHLLPESWILYNKIFQSDRGLFFMDGEEWLHYRKIMNKLLLKNSLSEGVLKSYEFILQDFIDNWKQYNNKEVPDLNNELYKLSVSMLIADLIGSSYPQHKTLFEEDIDKMSSTCNLIFLESSKLSLMPAKWAAFLRLPVWKRFTNAVSSSMTIANKMVREMLPLAASDGLLQKMSSESIPLDKIASIIVDFIIATTDTTSHTLVWSLYLLGRDRQLQDRVADVVKKLDTPTEILSEPLLRSLSKETLRLYPAAPFLTRALVAETNIGGYVIPSGQMMIMSIYTSGKNEEYFPNPTKFWPERWCRTQNGNHLAVNNPQAFLPFAIGARSCIGRKLAETQMTLLLSRIISNFHLEVLEEVEMVLKLVPVPARPVRLRISGRNI